MVQLPKLLLSFFKTLILAVMRKQKLFNKGNSVLFIDSTSIKVSPDANRSQDNQDKVLDVQKGANNEVTFMLYSFVSSSLSFISRQLS